MKQFIDNKKIKGALDYIVNSDTMTIYAFASFGDEIEKQAPLAIPAFIDRLKEKHPLYSIELYLVVGNRLVKIPENIIIEE